MWVASHHFAATDSLMLALSAAGRSGLVWLVLGLLIAVWRPSTAAAVWQMAIAIFVASQLTDHVIKPAVARDRPFRAVMDVRVIDERPTTYSFPSGHAATAFAGAYGLSRAWPRTRQVFWGLAALIAFSRIYVGVHYPTDVLAGAMLGTASAYFVFGGSRPRPAVRGRVTA